MNAELLRSTALTVSMSRLAGHAASLARAAGKHDADVANATIDSICTEYDELNTFIAMLRSDDAMQPLKT